MPTGKKQCSPTSKLSRTPSNRFRIHSSLLKKIASFASNRSCSRRRRSRTDQLSEVLYKNGGASYLQVLTSETNYFSAELNLVQAQLNERLALVQLYQALGGGWLQ